MSKFSMAFEGDAARVKLIAFFLPQFHPIPENDEWWGRGFTEWTNATKAVPQFPGHYQPHLPADLGFYDLRLRQSRHDQIEMAKEYGIDGFCYHYYWFSGKRILNAPVDDMLTDAQSDMPFCLCWANENWTRRWDGLADQILIGQKYRPEDDLEFIKDLVPFFRDPRYIQLDGAPFLIVYQPQHLPDVKRTVQTWKDYCSRAGISKIHLCCALTHGNWDYKQFGFDSGVHFPPNNDVADNLSREMKVEQGFEGRIFDYKEMANLYLAQKNGAHNVFRTVVPSWDNTARRGRRALIGLNGTPENYEYWLSESIRRTREEYPGRDRFVFINAWNEWAEGCHLEPCQKYGKRFLEATINAKYGRTKFDSFPHVGIPAESLAKPPPSFAEDSAAWVLRHLKTQAQNWRWTRERWAKRLQNMIRNMRVSGSVKSE